MAKPISNIYREKLILNYPIAVDIYRCSIKTLSIQQCPKLNIDESILNINGNCNELYIHNSTIYNIDGEYGKLSINNSRIMLGTISADVLIINSHHNCNMMLKKPPQKLVLFDGKRYQIHEHYGIIERILNEYNIIYDKRPTENIDPVTISAQDSE